MMSSGLAKIAKAGQDGMRGVRNAVNDVNAAISNGANRIAGFGKASENAASKAIKSNRALGGSYRSLLDEISKVERKIQESNNLAEIGFNKRRLKGLNMLAQRHEGNLATKEVKQPSLGDNLVVGAIATTVGYGIKQGISEALKQSATKENQNIAFKVLTGSEVGGKQMYKNIVKMADKTPFESSDLSRSAKTQLGYGVNKKDIMRNMNMFGDIASGQDDPTQALHSISLAFGQIYAKGHLAGQEVLQLVNAGFNPLKEISIMTGKSMATLEKEMAKGQITVKMVQDAFAHATDAGGKFHGMMQEQSKTMTGMWSTFMDLVHSKLRTFGDFLQPLAKGMMTFFSAILNNKAALIGLAIGLGALVFVVMKAAMGVGIFKTALDALKVAITTNPATMWIGAIAIGIGLLLPLFDSLFGKTNEINAAFADLTNTANLTNDINKQSSAVAGEQISKAKLLIDKVRDLTLDESIRKQSLNELKNVSADYFGKFDMQTIMTEKATKALSDYTSAVTQHAIALAAADKYKEIESEFINTQLKNHEEAAKKVFTKTIQTGVSGGLMGTADGTAKVSLQGKELEQARKAWEAQNNTVAETARNTSQSILKGLMDKDKNSLLSMREAKQDKANAPSVESDKTARGVVSGGPRIININGVQMKLADKIEVFAKNTEDFIDKLEPEMKVMWLRLLNSGASIQTN